MNRASPPNPAPAAEPRELHAHALEHLRFIRGAMTRASSFTAVPGWGQVAMGLSALPAAAIAARQPSDARWLAVWIAEAFVAMAIGFAALAGKARRLRQPMLTGAGRRFAFAFALPVVAAALLTAALADAGQYGALPGLWLLLYGVAVAAGGAFAVPIVPIMGGCFMALGAAGLFLRVPRDLLMVLGFGVLHVGFGAIVARRHGG
jgi:hypothetical protein